MKTEQARIPINSRINTLGLELGEDVKAQIDRGLTEAISGLVNWRVWQAVWGGGVNWVGAAIREQIYEQNKLLL